MRTRNAYTCRGQRAYTLLELLVVISIIAILATTGMTGWGVAMEAARRAHAHTDCLRLQNSLSQYRALEGPFPKSWRGPQTTDDQFLSALMGERSSHNRTGTSYFQVGQVQSEARAHGFVVSLNQYNDPWGRPYRVYLDVENSGHVVMPVAYRARFGSELRGHEVFVHSAGKDGDFKTVRDNITSLD